MEVGTWGCVQATSLSYTPGCLSGVWYTVVLYGTHHTGYVYTHTQCAGGHWFALNCQLFWKLALLLEQIFIVFVLKFVSLSLSLPLSC